jgi:hypothetical protein
MSSEEFYSADPDKIEVGDTVSVNCSAAQLSITRAAKVLRIPQGPGDSWGFRDLRTGDLLYVSEGCTVRLFSKREVTPASF